MSKHWPAIRRAALVVGASLSVAAVATGQWLPILGRYIWSGPTFLH